MFIVIFLVLLFLALVVHELSHGRVMRRYGIEVPEGGLGLPISGLPHLKIRISPTFTFCIHPVLLGAYVKATNEEDIEKLSYAAKSHIFGAGLNANLIMGFILLALATIWGMICNIELLIWNPVIVLVVSAVLPIGLWFGSRLLSIYLYPILGFPLLGYLVWSIIKVGLAKSLMGPVGAIDIASRISTFPGILLWGAMVSIGLAFVNLLPILPLDGGRTLQALIRKMFGKNETLERNLAVIGIFLVALLVVMVMYTDILRLLS